MYKSEEKEIAAYKYSAELFKKYTQTVNLHARKNEISEVYSHFQSLFNWRTLKTYSDAKLLNALFGNDEDSLAHFCLYDDILGSTGGPQVKSTLPVYKMGREWYRPKKKPIELDEAVRIAREFRDAFVRLQKGIEKIRDSKGFNCIEDYQNLADYMIGINWETNWAQKTLQLLYPDVFAEIYEETWQKRALCTLAVVPDENPICRNGQLALIARNAGCENAWLFANKYYGYFGMSNSATILRYNVSEDDLEEVPKWKEHGVLGLMNSIDADGLKKLRINETEESDLGPIVRLVVICHKNQILGIGVLRGFCEDKEIRDLVLRYGIRAMEIKHCEWYPCYLNTWLLPEEGRDMIVSDITSMPNWTLIMCSYFNMFCNDEKLTEICDGFGIQINSFSEQEGRTENHTSSLSCDKHFFNEENSESVFESDKNIDSKDTKTQRDINDDLVDVIDQETIDESELEELRINREININLIPVEENYVYEPIPEPKTEEDKQSISSKGTYSRSAVKRMHALIRACYCCEYDENHESFESRRTGMPYMETHHLIPIEYSNRFVYKLDVEANIVCLCSNCHNRIHYGKDSAELIEHLYEKRRGELEKAGIPITIDKLLRMY